MHTCIYCKKEKEDSEFNREHVVPRMMGRYSNAPVLSDYQVCQECNSYFSKEIEGKISLDSYEAFLRMRSGTKIMSDGRRLSNNRISLTGAEGLFKGLAFQVVTDTANPERIHFEISPCIGIKKSADEYDYYPIDELPPATLDKVQALKEFESPIIQFGYDHVKATKALIEKGYITKDAEYSEKSIVDEYGSPDFTASIKISIDSYVRRVCAKTVFNYLCWSTSAENMLDTKFETLRKYIRDGVWNDSLWFRYSQGFVTAAKPPNKTAHMIGTMIYRNSDTQMWELLGCVTWFGEITYIMRICDVSHCEKHDVGNGFTYPDYDTEFMYFDNETGNINRESALFIYGGRP